MSKRRGHGEGSIHQRTDGRWAATLDLGWENGKRRRKSFYGKTRREVAEKLGSAVQARRQGLPVTNDRRKTGEYLAWWVDAVLPNAVRPSTEAGYAGIVRKHLVPTIGRIPLAKLAPHHVTSLMNERLERGYSPQTVKNIHACLRRALGQAVRWGLVPRNVAGLASAPRVQTSEVRPLTPEEARHLLLVARGDRLYALYAVALAVGLRRGEALGLHWGDVDLDAGLLKVQRSLQRVNGELRFMEPKTARSRRTITLPASCIEALRDHRRRQVEERLAAGPSWQEHELIFSTGIGTPIDPRNIHRSFYRIRKNAGLTCRFHDLRHTCASLLLAQNVHPRVVMEILGHSTIGVTMDVYSHVMPALEREAVERLDALLLG